jgi:hypothetical protein
VRDFGAFEARATQAAVVFVSQFSQYRFADFYFAAPTTVQVDFTGECLATRRTLLRAV